MLVGAEQCTFENFNFKYWKTFKYFCAYLKENVWNSVENIYSKQPFSCAYRMLMEQFGSNTLQLLVAKCSHQDLAEQFC